MVLFRRLIHGYDCGRRVVHWRQQLAKSVDGEGEGRVYTILAEGFMCSSVMIFTLLESETN